MADIPISQLPELQATPTDGSELIINDKSSGTAITKRVAMSYLNMGGSAGFTMDPIIVNFKASNGESSTTKTTGAWAQSAPQRDWFTSTNVSVPIPEEATHFYVEFFTWNSWRLGSGASGTSLWGWRQYAQHNVKILNGTGTFFNSSDPTAIKMQICHNVAISPTWNNGGANDQRYSTINNQKMKMAKINAAASGGFKNVTFQATVDLIMGGHNSMSAYLGDLLIIPIVANDPSEYDRLINEQNVYADDPEGLYDYDIPQSDANKFDAIRQGAELRQRALYTIEAVNSKLDITERYINSPTPNANPIVDWDTEKQILEALLVDLYQILYLNTYKGNALISEAATNNALADVFTIAGGYISLPFTFEVNAGVTAADITLGS